MGDIALFENGAFAGKFHGRGKATIQQDAVKRITFASGCRGKFTNKEGKTGMFTIVSYEGGQFTVMKSTVATANIHTDLIHDIIFLDEDSKPRGESKQMGRSDTSSSSQSSSSPRTTDVSASQNTSREHSTGAVDEKTLMATAEVFVRENVDAIYLIVFTKNGGTTNALKTLPLEPPEMTEEERLARDKLIEAFVKMTSATDLGVTKAQYANLLLDLKTTYTIQRRALPASRFCRFQLQCVLALTCYLKADEVWEEYFDSQEDGKEISIRAMDAKALSAMGATINWRLFKSGSGVGDAATYAVPYDIMLSLYWELADGLTKMMFKETDAKVSGRVDHGVSSHASEYRFPGATSKNMTHSVGNNVATGTIPLENQNALQAAQNYLAAMPFSQTKLIDQLVDLDGYSRSAASYAVSRCGADWDQQAKRSAENYLATMPFSREGLIEQLIFDGFTQSQAEYGSRAAGY